MNELLQQQAFLNSQFNRAFAPATRRREQRIAKAREQALWDRQVKHEQSVADRRRLREEQDAAAALKYIESFVAKNTPSEKAVLPQAIQMAAAQMNPDDAEKLSKLTSDDGFAWFKKDPMAADMAIQRLSPQAQALVAQSILAIQNQASMAAEQRAMRMAPLIKAQIASGKAPDFQAADAAIMGGAGNQTGNQGNQTQDTRTELEKAQAALEALNGGNGATPSPANPGPSPRKQSSGMTNDQRNAALVGGAIAAPYVAKVAMKVPRALKAGGKLLEKGINAAGVRTGAMPVAGRAIAGRVAAPIGLHSAARTLSPWLADAEDNYAIQGVNGNTYDPTGTLGFEAVPFGLEQAGNAAGDVLSRAIYGDPKTW